MINDILLLTNMKQYYNIDISEVCIVCKECMVVTLYQYKTTKTGAKSRHSEFRSTEQKKTKKSYIA